MMIRHFLLHAPGASALERWHSAFPGQLAMSDPARLSAGTPAPGDLVWIDARRDDWEPCTRASASRGASVVLLSATPAAAEAARALDLGARGYSHVFATVEQFHEIEAVLQHGGLWLGADLMRSVLNVAGHLATPETVAGRMQGLSQRERAVAALVAEGLSNKRVAVRLDITERTVKAHLGAVFVKLGVRDRLQLALRLAGR
jgi:two-component system, NarL family, nitrate/nitrite response regulator NarL